MPLTEAQIRAATAPGSVAVTAGAGTGKTHLLTERYLHHLREDGMSPLQIVAVTFTERAAAELRARIREAVGKAKDCPPGWLPELEAAQISTIHALAARICRDHYDLAGIPADFRVLDEQEGAIWRAEHFATALEQIPLESFVRIPFSLMSAAMRLFLADPDSAEKALGCDAGSWCDFVTAARAGAWAKLRASEQWRSAGAMLGNEGPPGDLIEAQRAMARAAWSAIENGEAPDGHLPALCGITLRGGSAKKWGEETFTAMKGFLTTLRDLVKGSQSLLTLELNAADERIAELLPTLRDAFAIVQAELTEAKLRARVLDFNDLEHYALKILRQPAAQEFYALRWKAFLVDEFQDTNPVQGELIDLLTRHARITVVGDEQQSIYGFRRADVQVFATHRERVVETGGQTHELSVTFRAHEELIVGLNRIFAPVLNELHRPMTAERRTSPHPGPHITAFHIESEERVAKSASQRVEAHHLTQQIASWLREGLLVHDKSTGQLRALRPGDVAILSRAWNSLDYYADALAAEGIPAVHAGGGDLLAVREVQDAVALLRFLSDEEDDLALVAVLRSPYFAVSDRDLHQFANTLGRSHWWPKLNQSTPPALARPVAVLQQVSDARAGATPRQLLQMADALTGYNAVIANLPNAARRLADLRRFSELLSQWERSGFDDAFGVWRNLRTLMQAEVELPRPPLDAGDAVSLMTIHAAKGLEWPIVVVPDLARQTRSDHRPVKLDPEIGVAFNLDPDDELKPAIYTAIGLRQQEREAAEARRVLYVALTRARDRLLLSATKDSGGALDLLLPGLAAAGVELQAIEFDEAAARPPAPRPLARDGSHHPELIEPIPRLVTEISVTNLYAYSVCPKRFHYHVVLGFPDPSREEPDGAADLAAGEEIELNALARSVAATSPNIAPAASAADELPLFAAITRVVETTDEVDRVAAETARRIGILTHRALERNIAEVDALAVMDPSLSPEQVAEALALAEGFRREPAFARFRGPESVDYLREWPIAFETNGIRLIGTIDLAGSDFILDYKTGRHLSADEHRFQLWAYARAAGVSTAYLADLRRGELHAYDASALAAIEREASDLLHRLRLGDFAATPSVPVCRVCPYRGICPASAV
jgi:ATP-dependent helicase/nuclease subunit A